MTLDSVTFAPGSRLLIRDEEWLVKNSLPVNTGGAAVRVIGLSELVRNHEAIFLSNIDDIQELKPEETRLVKDDSPQYRRSRLYLESLLRRTPPSDAKVYLGHQGALEYVPYQTTPAHKALQALRPRILIADGVGLGKTIEAGILMSELIKRGRGERILVVAIKSMLTQFQEEIWARFAIPLVRLDSVGLQRVRARIPSNKNPFYYYDRVIISVDTLKNDAQYRHYLEQCHWDIIVIDECHNVANAGSQRNRLADLLARTCDSLILTSATPHNGRPESFANLMNMLEPTAIADQQDYSADEIDGLFVRRFKKDIEDQVADAFSERQTHLVRTIASPAEEKFFNKLASARFRTLRRGRFDALYRIGLLKGFLSSSGACLQTITQRLNKVNQRILGDEGAIDDIEDAEDLAEADWDRLGLFEGTDSAKDQALADLHADKALLEELRDLATAIGDAEFTKYRQLLTLLRELSVTGRPDSPRVIIFSERLRTLQFLQERLMKEFGVDEEVIVRFHAGLQDVRQQEIVESFGKSDSPIRILLASDVASEGVNLHYYCHLMIHFDIPWSLITMEQRNGRIDRYGQHTSPAIYYLLTQSKNAELRGDLRVLERLIEKEQEAHKNIGDAAIILKLYEAEKEEKHIVEAMADGKSAEEILPDKVDPDWLTELMAATSAVDVDDGVSALGSFTLLFKDDLSFARAGFEELRQADDEFDGRVVIQPEFHPDRPEFTFMPPADLRQRLEFMPREALPKNGEFRLTTNRRDVMNAMAEARKRQGEWSQLQLFWELHPVMEWLTDRLLVRFGRHEAPIVISRKTPNDTVILLFQGIISNLRSQPLINEWMGLQLPVGRGEPKFLTLDEVLSITGFLEGIPNPGKEPFHNQTTLRRLVVQGVELAREHMKKMRLDRGQELSKQLADDSRKLKRWYDASQQSIAAQRMNAQGAREARLLRQQDHIRALYEHRRRWLEDSLKAVDEPYLRLALVFTEL